MNLTADDFYLGKWLVSPSELSISDGEVKRKLEPKAMDLLLVLAQAEGAVVSRDAIFRQVWKNQLIADHVLYNLIANLRKVLEDDPRHPAIIITIPKTGYRLAVPTIKKSTENASGRSIKALSKRSLIAGAVLLMFCSLVIFRFVFPPGPPALHSATSIAVLPLDVFDSQPATQYFADGLAEEIIHQLTVIPELTVTARTSSFAFRNENLDIKTLADKLNVDYVMEGSVRKDNATLRITVQLIQASNGTHVWSKVFTVRQQDIFTLQRDISLAVVQSLAPDYALLSSGKLRKHPETGEAYLHFLRGSAMTSKATPAYIQQALDEFEEAVSLQPDYALAHAAIALNTMILYQYRLLPADAARNTAQGAIDTALDVAPYLPVAHAAQWLLHINFGEFSQAERAFKTALDLDPNLALAHHNYGYLLWIQDKQAAALEHFTVALVRNPMSAITNFAVANTLFNTGQLRAALKQYQHCVALLPDYPACRLGLANFYRFTQQAEFVDEQMSVARQQLSQQDIYLITAHAVDLFWRGEYQQAQQYQQQMQLTQGGGYLDHQLSILLHLFFDEQGPWLREMLALARTWPDNQSLNVALSLGYYLMNDCEHALNIYEDVTATDPYFRGKFSTVVWGISHLANMAYCYQQQGNEKATQMLVLLRTQLDGYDLDGFTLPGADVVKARLLLLSEQTGPAIETLNSPSIQNWQLNWLLRKDPTFDALRGEIDVALNKP